MALLLLSCLLAPDESKSAARARALAATVKVVNDGDRAEGSGVLLRQHGQHVYILTAAHVVPAARTVAVEISAGKPRQYAGVTVLARSAEADLAVLRLRTQDELPAALPLAPPLKKASLPPSGTFSVGWSRGNRPTATEETVRGSKLVRRPEEKSEAWHWETTGKPVLGRSGGPLVDTDGRILGIASGHDREHGYYVHGDEIRAFLRREGLKWLTEADDR